MTFPVKHIEVNGQPLAYLELGEGPLVVCLHGFPDSAYSYELMLPVLAAAGYRVVAPFLRGYYPSGLAVDNDYSIPTVAGDVLGLITALGEERASVIGHDWGAGVGWGMVLAAPARIQTWTALSIPHVGAFADAIESDPEQQEKSAYMAFFRMPGLPETLFTFNGLAMMNAMYAEHLPDTREEYLALFAEPGALTAALNWYRAAGSLASTQIEYRFFLHRFHVARLRSQAFSVAGINAVPD